MTATPAAGLVNQRHAVDDALHADRAAPHALVVRGVAHEQRLARRRDDAREPLGKSAARSSGSPPRGRGAPSASSRSRMLHRVRRPRRRRPCRAGGGGARRGSASRGSPETRSKTRGLYSRARANTRDRAADGVVDNRVERLPGRVVELPDAVGEHLLQRPAQVDVLTESELPRSRSRSRAAGRRPSTTPARRRVCRRPAPLEGGGHPVEQVSILEVRWELGRDGVGARVLRPRLQDGALALPE